MKTIFNTLLHMYYCIVGGNFTFTTYVYISLTFILLVFLNKNIKFHKYISTYLYKYNRFLSKLPIKSVSILYMIRYIFTILHYIFNAIEGMVLHLDEFNSEDNINNDDTNNKDDRSKDRKNHSKDDKGFEPESSKDAIKRQSEKGIVNLPHENLDDPSIPSIVVTEPDGNQVHPSIDRKNTGKQKVDSDYDIRDNEEHGVQMEKLQRNVEELEKINREYNNSSDLSKKELSTFEKNYFDIADEVSEDIQDLENKLKLDNPLKRKFSSLEERFTESTDKFQSKLPEPKSGSDSEFESDFPYESDGGENED